MKVLNLKIKNLRLITDEIIEFNKPLILLYGDVQQGKTTFLDAIKILFSNGFPDDLIQHGKDEADITLNLEDGFISRSFYIAKDGTIKGRSLTAIVNGKKLSSKELKEMFNPFQLDQDYLKNMTTTERNKFMIDLFNVDTKDIDSLIIENTKLHNKKRDEQSQLIQDVLQEKEYISHLNKLSKYVDRKAVELYISNLKQPEPPRDYYQELANIDKSKLESIQIKINAIDIELIKWEANEKQKAKYEDKQKLESTLSELVKETRELRSEKVSKLQEYGKEIPNLEFTEDGNIIFEGTLNDNLSTSQIVMLGSELSKLYPNSLLDLELLDRGESLGKSIFNYIEKAKKNNRTVLATIVGDKPAKNIEDVGIFVVEKGQLK